MQPHVDAELEITAEELATSLAATAAPLLVDVRESDEHATGILAGARLVPLRELERAFEDGGAPYAARDRPIVLYCASGRRSAQGARALRRLGFRDVRSLHGGIDAWRIRGLPVSPLDATTAPAITRGLSPDQLDRYARQLRLSEVGIEGQRRLLDARVLCIGAGGLGSPACVYLAAAGVGEIGIVDDDVVALSNLHRQILHTTARIGEPKTESASQMLAALNPDVRLRLHRERLTRENARTLIADHDLVIDGSDNFATRYVVNDAALQLGKPAIFGAVLRFEGQVAVVNGAPCYRCLFPEAPPAEFAPSCVEAGVLGVVPGIVGTLQATEALKLLLGIGESLRGRLLTIDTLTMEFTTLNVRADPACPSCGAKTNGAAHR